MEKSRGISTYLSGNAWKDVLVRCILFTFVFGLIANGYVFFNHIPSHDSIVEMFGHKYHNTSLGRFLVPLYNLAFGDGIQGVPVTSGVVGLLWISFSAFFVIEVFNIRNKTIQAILCGVMSANMTVTALGLTYMECFSQQLCALLLSVVAVYFWNLSIAKGKGYLVLPGMLCIWAALGMYQAYIGVFATLVVLKMIFDLLDGGEKNDKFRLFLRQAVGAAVMVLIGGGAYYLCLKPMCRLVNVSLYEGSYNSVGNVFVNSEPIIARIRETLLQTKEVLFNPSGYIYPNVIPRVVNIGLLIVAVEELVCMVLRTRNWKAAGLATVLLVCLPFAMNCIRLINGTVHILMQYSICFGFYLLVLLLLDRRNMEDQDRASNRRLPGRTVRIVAEVLFCCVMLGNIQVANTAYVKKDMEGKATFSVMTRVVDRVESLDGYIPGSVPVVFVGTPASYLYDNEYLADMHGIIGMGDGTPITYEGVYSSYLNYMMNVNMCFEFPNESHLSIAQSMPPFPAEESVKMVDGTVIVKW